MFNFARPTFHETYYLYIISFPKDKGCTRERAHKKKKDETSDDKSTLHNLQLAGSLSF